jgi:hypothetical protein
MRQSGERFSHKCMSEAVGLCGVTDSPSCAKTRYGGPAAQPVSIMGLQVPEAAVA